jgi:bifunctional UDP-N-acetylglucosamine pyrophosphorylase / glucosamine-1-phosphate N-acetyltransferase
LKKTACIILAGGPGKRMGSDDTPKVCFPIGGTPAIVRAIDAYKRSGLERFVVVVSYMAEQVMAAVATAHPEVTFAYQVRPMGTGHAASVAVETLASEGYTGTVVVAVGDMLAVPGLVRQVLATSDKTASSAVLTALPKASRPTAGRVVLDLDGNIVGIVELPDIIRARDTGEGLVVGDETLAADEVEKRSDTVNASLYAFEFTALREALEQIRPENAQSELYLTDVIEILARRGKVEAVTVDDANDLMSFNTPEELARVSEVFGH